MSGSYGSRARVHRRPQRHRSIRRPFGRAPIGRHVLIDATSGWKVDLIHRNDRPFSHDEFARRTATVLDAVPLAVATVEDVLPSKLEWACIGGSRRQLEDAATLLRVRRGELDEAYMTQWVEELGVAAEWSAVAENLARDRKQTRSPRRFHRWGSQGAVRSCGPTPYDLGRVSSRSRTRSGWRAG